MISILIINNNERNLKKIKNIDYNDLYKKCGYKTNDNFKKLYEKKINNIVYEYWGKDEGKNIYKYILNNITYYNKLLIIKIIDNNFENISENDYDNIFNNKISNIDNNKNNILDNNENSDTNNEDNKILSYNSESELSEESYIFSSDEEN
jgi:hypothetical protein